MIACCIVFMLDHAKNYNYYIDTNLYDLLLSLVASLLCLHTCASKKKQPCFLSIYYLLFFFSFLVHFFPENRNIHRRMILCVYLLFCYGFSPNRLFFGSYVFVRDFLCASASKNGDIQFDVICNLSYHHTTQTCPPFLTITIITMI